VKGGGKGKRKFMGLHYGSNFCHATFIGSILGEERYLAFLKARFSLPDSASKISRVT
jgi:hypothetical protein